MSVEHPKAGTPSWSVPYFDLRLGPEERDAVLGVLASNWLAAGPQCAALEREFATALGVPREHAVAATNCTAALHLALVINDLGPGDEVILPSLTFVATANVIRQTGANPVFADIVSDDEWNIDPADVAAKITPRTKAVMVVHYGGYPVRMDAISQLGDANGLRVIEDACHGPLAEYDGRKLGTIGDVGCFSFYSNKNMTTGEGGMLIARDRAAADKARAIRSHGMTSTTFQRFAGTEFSYDVEYVGYNYRLDDLRAAIGVAQLAKLPGVIDKRAELVARYRDKCAAIVPDVGVPFTNLSGRFGFHIFPVLLPPGYGDRAGLMSRMAERGVQTSIHYRPVHSFSAYSDIPANVPKTDSIASRILTLPLFPTLEEWQIDHVLNSLRDSL